MQTIATAIRYEWIHPNNTHFAPSAAWRNYDVPFPAAEDPIK